MLEYWTPEAPLDLPTSVYFSYKSETDLYEFKKTSSTITSLTISPDGEQFVTLGLSDRQVRVFHFPTGKMSRRYDESLKIIEEMQQVSVI